MGGRFVLVLDSGMRQLQIGKNQFQIPDSWDDISLDMYNAAIAQLREHAAVPRRAMAMAICVLCNVKEGILLIMEPDQVMQLRAALSFFFETEPKPKLEMEFEAGGIVFQVPSEIEQQTFGEFVDLDSTITKHREDLRQAMPEIMAIYCRPLGEPYLVDNLEYRSRERTRIMGSVPIELAEGLAAFFLTSTDRPPIISSQFGLLRVSLIKTLQMQSNSLKRTGGWQRLRTLPKMMFYKWMRSRLKSAATF